MASTLCRLSVIVLTLTTFGATGLAQSKTGRDELPNFHKVNDHLYRGAQPVGDGYRKLAELGVKTVIDLRGGGRRAQEEEARAKAAGLRYVNIPLPGWGRPDDRQVERALALMDAPENWPVMVHCWKGADRTGTVIACYRIWREGWTAERAGTEAAQHGMSRVQWWMKDYIRDYHRNRQRQSLTPGADFDDRLGRGMSAIEHAMGKGILDRKSVV